MLHFFFNEGFPKDFGLGSSLWVQVLRSWFYTRFLCHFKHISIYNFAGETPTEIHLLIFLKFSLVMKRTADIFMKLINSFLEVYILIVYLDNMFTKYMLHTQGRRKIINMSDTGSSDSGRLDAQDATLTEVMTEDRGRERRRSRDSGFRRSPQRSHSNSRGYPISSPERRWE